MTKIVIVFKDDVLRVIVFSVTHTHVTCKLENISIAYFLQFAIDNIRVHLLSGVHTGRGVSGSNPLTKAKKKKKSK